MELKTLLVLGDLWWFLVVYGDLWLFLMIYDGFWWFQEILSYLPKAVSFCSFWLLLVVPIGFLLSFEEMENKISLVMQSITFFFSINSMIALAVPYKRIAAQVGHQWLIILNFL